MDFGPIIKARKALGIVWEKADLKGRCWGPKKAGNPYALTNITIAVGKEIVTISQTKTGKLKIHQFSQKTTTLLGKEIIKILQKAGLSCEK